MKKKDASLTKVLFISRAYPPTIGGMETFSFELIRHLARHPQIKATAIVNKKGKKALPLFLPATLVKTVLSAGRYDLIHLADAVLAPIGDIVKMIHPKAKVVTTLHGLDLTYAEKNNFYKKINIEALKALDGLVAVSEATKKQALALGIPNDKVTVIPNGVNPEKAPAQKKEAWIELFDKRKLTTPKAEQTPILSLGRLQKRKGVTWFIREIFPLLDKRAVYLVAGSGPEEEAIKKAIQKSSEKTRILFVGAVSEAEKQILMAQCPIFVQPNFTVAGDMEGFGITMLEASAAGAVVVATRVDGIPEAISHQKNGWLTEEKNIDDLKTKINRLLANPQKTKALGQDFRANTLERFSWTKIAERYWQLFARIIDEPKPKNNLGAKK